MSNDFYKTRQNVLIRLINSVSSSSKSLQWCERQSKLSYLSVDKESVYDHFDGLVEKFDILGRNDLSMELEKRFEELKVFIDGGGKNILECLTLIKELSNNPLGNKVKFDEVQQEVPLTWDDIIRDDPLEGDHWNELELDSEVESEGEDAAQVEPGTQDTSRPRSRSHSRAHSRAHSRSQINSTPDPFVHLEQYTIDDSLVMIENLKSSYWIDKPILSNTDVIREIFFSLLGTPSVLFNPSSDLFNQVTVNKNFSLIIPHLTTQISFEVLEEFALYSSIMAQLKQYSLIYFVSSKFPHFNYKYILGILDEVHQSLEATILQFQDDLLNKDETVSISNTLLIIRQLLKPYGIVVSVMKTVSAVKDKNTLVALLDELYEQISIYNTEDILPLIEIFSKVINDYIRLLTPWLEKGLIVDDASFLIETDTNEENDWNRYKIIDGNVVKFLSNYSNSILNSGRAACLLSNLAVPPNRAHLSISLASTDFINILDLQLNEYFKTTEKNNNQLLYNHLISQCFLKESLQNHVNIYFMLDGYSSSLFLNNLFERIEEGLPIDRYSISDCLEETWSGPTITSVIKADSTDFQINISIPTTNVVKTILSLDNLKIYQSIWWLLIHCRRLVYHLVRKQDKDSNLFLCLDFLNNYLLYLETVIKRFTNVFEKKLEALKDFQQVLDYHNEQLRVVYKQSLLGTNAKPALLDLLQFGYELYQDNTTATFDTLYNTLQMAIEQQHDDTIQSFAEVLNKIHYH